MRNLHVLHRAFAVKSRIGSAAPAMGVQHSACFSHHQRHRLIFRTSILLKQCPLSPLQLVEYLVLKLRRSGFVSSFL